MNEIADLYLRLWKSLSWQFVSAGSYFDCEQKPFGELIFQMLCRAYALELAIDHDG